MDAPEVFPRDAEGLVTLRAVRQDHGVVPRREVVHGDVSAERDVSQERHARIREHGVEAVRHRFRRRVVRGDARAHEAERRGEALEDVHPSAVAVVRQQPVRRVHPRGAGTDDAEELTVAAVRARARAALGERGVDATNRRARVSVRARGAQRRSSDGSNPIARF